MIGNNHLDIAPFNSGTQPRRASMKWENCIAPCSVMVVILLAVVVILVCIVYYMRVRANGKRYIYYKKDDKYVNFALLSRHISTSESNRNSEEKKV